MTPADLVQRTLAGEATPRPPYGFWTHYPETDLDPEAIARGGGQRGKRLSESDDVATLRRQHTGDQVQQRAFSGATLAMNEHLFIRRHLEIGNVQASRGLIRPAEQQVFQRQQGLWHAGQLTDSLTNSGNAFSNLAAWLSGPWRWALSLSP